MFWECFFSWNFYFVLRIQRFFFSSNFRMIYRVVSSLFLFYSQKVHTWPSLSPVLSPPLSVTPHRLGFVRQSRPPRRAQSGPLWLSSFQTACRGRSRSGSQQWRDRRCGRLNVHLDSSSSSPPEALSGPPAVKTLFVHKGLPKQRCSVMLNKRRENAADKRKIHPAGPKSYGSPEIPNWIRLKRCLFKYICDVGAGWAVIFHCLYT